MSSSSSCARAADILDLDRYMRATVRPPPHHTRERLVVDAGGADRVPVACSSVDSMRSPRPRDHAKRYSHDSGLSDESYAKRRHRPHRRASEVKRGSSRVESKSSVREFRAACEQVLREQQEQISRVTELCQKLVQPQAGNQNLLASQFVPNGQNPKFDMNKQKTTIQQTTQSLEQTTNERKDQPTQYGQNYMKQQQTVPNDVVKQNFGQNVNQVMASDSSDVSSTSHSSRELRRKEKIRSDSCKTYKIIMNKLDELNHLFAARRNQSPVHSSLITRRTAPTKLPSSECVSVCNKVVATEDLREQKHIYGSAVQGFPMQMVHTRINHNSDVHGSRLSIGRGRGLAMSRAHEVDIAPGPRGASVHPSQGEGGEGEGWSEAPQDFDLDNPLKLYAQAKRLQALHASTRRTNQSNRTADKLDEELGDQLDGRSLCALCRFYWRALRRCLTQQLFGACS